MILIAEGLNFQTSTLDIRETMAFSHEQATSLISDLLQTGLVEEALLLCTCNRTELYSVGLGAKEAFQWLRNQSKKTDIPLYSQIYQHQGEEAVRHLMRVASGLDSMVIGEAEILGQIKSTYRRATLAGTIGKCLGKLFQQAFAVA